MSFVIDEPENPRETRRTVYGVHVLVEVVGAAGHTALISQVIPFGMPGPPVILRPGEWLEARIIDPDGRVT